MLHMPSPMLFGSAVVRTYSEFQARLVAIADTTATGGTASAGPTVALSPRKIRVTSLAASGSMGGSPWASLFTDEFNTYSRIAQHACPDEATFTECVSSSRPVYMEISGTNTAPSMPSLTRNGYTSVAVGSGQSLGMRCDKFIYWDAALGRPMETSPAAGTGPIPYDW